MGKMLSLRQELSDWPLSSICGPGTDVAQEGWWHVTDSLLSGLEANPNMCEVQMPWLGCERLCHDNRTNQREIDGIVPQIQQVLGKRNHHEYNLEGFLPGRKRC